MADPHSERAFARAWTLSEESDDAVQLFQATIGRMSVYLGGGRFDRADEMAQHLAGLMRRIPLPPFAFARYLFIGHGPLPCGEPRRGPRPSRPGLGARRAAAARRVHELLGPRLDGYGAHLAAPGLSRSGTATGTASDGARFDGEPLRASDGRCMGRLRLRECARCGRTGHCRGDCPARRWRKWVLHAESRWAASATGGCWRSVASPRLALPPCKRASMHCGRPAR